MSQSVVVLGAGYAGAGAIGRLQDELDGEADITWVSERDYHLVLHEVHRCVRDPAVREAITVPVDDIAAPETTFVEASVADVDPTERRVAMEDGRTLSYDYLLVGLGSQTAFFDIPGLAEHAHTIKSLDDALALNAALQRAAGDATPSDPARVVVGGAGLSGIQTAGEVAAYRDERDAPISVELLEGLEEVLPGGPPALQAAIRDRLRDRDVAVTCGSFVTDVDEDVVVLDDESSRAYDVLVWTGGVTGRDALQSAPLEADDRSRRVYAGRDFRTSEERVFALGDCAIVDQPGDTHAPPTAQAAWQAAEVAGANVARALRGESLRTWRYRDRGTVVSIGQDAVAHDVSVFGVGLPVTTFGGPAARTLKKAIAAKWLATVDGTGRAVRAWPDM